MKDKNKKRSVYNNIKKVAIITLALILNTLTITNSVKASNLDATYVYGVNDCGMLLIYNGIEVKGEYVEYNKNGEHYPAYCLDKTKEGVGLGGYNVSVNSAINDVGLWRTIINGYPYKSIKELGVANREEAYMATKQAIYCYIHGNKLEDYVPIGEAGKRTLNAMKNIVENAKKSDEEKISSTVTINKNDLEWKQDKEFKEYVSKIYSVRAGSNIGNYKISIEKENNEELEGIKIMNEANEEKTEFKPNEKFKILIPIKNLTKDGKFDIHLKTTIETKPVLYGAAQESGRQDYALTAATYESGVGNTKDNYYKNETRIIIIKKDEEANKYLEGVEFQVLDKDKNVVYADLKTDENGQIVINNILPGTYYIKETNALDGYEVYEQLIEIKTELNQEITVTVNNSKTEEPKIDTKTQTSKSIANKTIKKLPVTGM